MDLATFRARFPEFARASDTLVVAALADAEGRAGVATGAAWQAQKIAYLAAHLLAVSPGGRLLRTTPGGTSVEGDATTPYLKEYLDLCYAEGAGPQCP
jgi:uncharacterized membrane protein YtjA (UPF0391 family)